MKRPNVVAASLSTAFRQAEDPDVTLPLTNDACENSPARG
jgi:hypothetical protein